MEDAYVPEGSEKIVLQVLNSIDAVSVFCAICFALYNVVAFIWQGKIRVFFVMCFYALTLFCLVSWLITSIA